MLAEIVTWTQAETKTYNSRYTQTRQTNVSESNSLKVVQRTQVPRLGVVVAVLVHRDQIVLPKHHNFRECEANVSHRDVSLTLKWVSNRRAGKFVPVDELKEAQRTLMLATREGELILPLESWKFAA